MNRHRLSDPLLRMQTDERLAVLAAHGGSRAFAVLVERHRPALLSFARRLGAAGGAEDVVQQALLQAWAALDRGARVEHVGAWLHRIVRNAAIRAAAATPASDELPATLVAATATADEVEMRQRTRDLLTEIERLPPRQREALLRLAVDGSSGEEVGRAMALEANAVRQLVHRARMRLRTAMGALVPWPIAAWAARGGGMLDGVVGGGIAGGATGAGLLKIGAVATTTAAVAVGAVGLAPDHGHRSTAGAVAGPMVRSGLGSTTVGAAGGRGALPAETRCGSGRQVGCVAGSRSLAGKAPRHPARSHRGSGGSDHGSGRDGPTRSDGGSRHDGGTLDGEHSRSGSSGSDGALAGEVTSSSEGPGDGGTTATQSSSGEGPGTSGDGGSLETSSSSGSDDGSSSSFSDGSSSDGGSTTTTTSSGDG